MTFPLYHEQFTTFSYEDPWMVQQMTAAIQEKLALSKQIIVICIGTDRATGDALGPLTGTLLLKSFPQKLHVYGTLHQPVHALNLQETVHNIQQTYAAPFIIAIDAALGRKRSIGSFMISKGPLRPGAALNKDLPEVGDISITGVVNVGGLINGALLQSTRLSLVHDMASKLSRTLKRVDMSLKTN